MKKLLFILALTPLNFDAQADNLGQTTYQIACQTCHAPRVAASIGAPAAFDKKAWAVRFKQAKRASHDNPVAYKTPMSYLLYSVRMGKKLMHHGGLCKEANAPNKNCTNQAYIDAIHYMSQR